MPNVTGFWNRAEARKFSPAVSRPDLVAARNAVADPQVRGQGDLRPWQRKPIRLSRAPIDNRVHFYHAIDDGKGGYIRGRCYAILSPYQFGELRKRKALEPWLDAVRDSGEIIETEPPPDAFAAICESY